MESGVENIEPVEEVLMSGSKRAISSYFKEVTDLMSPSNNIQCYGCSTRNSKLPPGLSNSIIEKAMEYILNENRIRRNFSIKWIRRIYNVGVSSKIQSKIFSSLVILDLTPQTSNLLKILIETTPRIEEQTCLLLLKFCSARDARNILEPLLKRSFCEKRMLQLYWALSDHHLTIDEINMLIGCFISIIDSPDSYFTNTENYRSCSHISLLNNAPHSEKLRSLIAWINFVVTIRFAQFRQDQQSDLLVKLNSRISRLQEFYSNMEMLEGVVNNLVDCKPEKKLGQPFNDLFHTDNVDF
ncbi:hypothetical protein RF11_11193 [Thelohanellus kitauei]|uniref:Uncharacterized protein n=1 Tax=Thelohanellus kitauei TaxID=669202 RepID=A0A0C2INU4_THEKT|nr:hypothetical protein RF11_11193 [Thelohanellus kitauei]